MKRNHFFGALAALAFFLCVPSLLEARPQITEYTLRVHIYGTNWNRNSSGYHAFGRANLFDEQGVPHGVEFTYDCQDHLMASTATEAYPARWKKPGQTLEVVFGEIGAKPDSFYACEMKVAMKPFVFYLHNHGIETESPQDFMANQKSQTPTIGPASAADIPVSANPNKLY